MTSPSAAISPEELKAAEAEQNSEKTSEVSDEAAAVQNPAEEAAENDDNGQVEPLDASVDNGKKGEPVVSLDSPGKLSDMEKKQKRAERFGVGVNFSEDEKRKLRASRFNASDKSGVAKATGIVVESETEKKNARAARFGTAKSASGNEEAKKKARADRFSGIDSSLEAEKKKARAARFGNDEGKNKKLRTETSTNAPVATAAQG